MFAIFPSIALWFVWLVAMPALIAGMARFGGVQLPAPGTEAGK
jgi:hypothetical protein